MGKTYVFRVFPKLLLLGLFGSSGFKTGPAKSPSKFGKMGVFETGVTGPMHFGGSGFETRAAERALCLTRLFFFRFRS